MTRRTAAFFALIVASDTMAADWNQWRGPLRNGVVLESPKMADSWPDAGPVKVWDSEPISSKRQGFGSVAVVKGKVYAYVNWRYQDPVSLTRETLGMNAGEIPSNVVAKLEEIVDVELASADFLDDWIDVAGIERNVKLEILSWLPDREVTGKDVVLCLDTTDGKTLWRFEQTSRPDESGGSSTPCVVDERVYVVGANADLYCLDADTGKKIWQTKVGSGIQHTSVAVTDGIVVAAVGPLIALNAETGETLWEQEAVPGSFSSPSIWRSGGKTYLLCNTRQDLSCVNLLDGAVAWKVPGGNNSSAAISQDYMAVFTGPRGLGLALYKLSPRTGELLWSVELPNRESSPLIYNGHVYAIGGGQANCVDLSTGEIKWQVEIPTDMTSPVVADGKIYSAAIHSLTMIAPTPETYTALSSASLPIGRCVSPAIVDGKLYMRLQTGVSCYDLTSDRSTRILPVSEQHKQKKKSTR